MENLNIFGDDFIFTKKINGKLCLHYILNYNDQKILKDIRFKKWLNEEKKKIGKSYILRWCENCNFIVYLKDFKELRKFKCCDNSSSKLICLFCGKFFGYQNYCCPLCGIMGTFSELLLNGEYSWFQKDSNFGFIDKLKTIPYIFHTFFI